jgi:membrane fusion protein (multidrug efflux system)
VSSSAIHEVDGQKVVFLLTGDHVERHAVKVGANNGTQTQILAGLSPGDTIVVEGPATLRDGEAVALRR